MVFNYVSSKFWFGILLSTYYIPDTAGHSFLELSPKTCEEHSVHLSHHSGPTGKGIAAQGC